MTWLLHDQLVVRTTGFPYEVLEELRLPRTAAALDALLDAGQRIEEHRERLLREVFPVAVRILRGDPAATRRLSKQRSAVGRRRPVADPGTGAAAGPAKALREWNRLLAEADALVRRAERTHLGELAGHRERLHALASDPRVRDAALLLSPAFAEGLERYARSAFDRGADGAGGRDSRRIELRFASYLQRLAAKNETNSFYGPVNYGRLVPGSAQAMRIERDPALVSRTVFATARLAEAVTTAIQADPRMRPHLRPRRSTGHRTDEAGATVNTATGRTVELNPEDARLVAAADGIRNVRELGRLLGEPWQVVADRFAELVRRGLLAVAPPAAPDTAFPLDALAERLAGLPDADGAVREWRAVVAELADLVAQCDTRPRDAGAAALRKLEERYEELAGEQARRGAGRMYADRTLVFEESRGDLARFDLGGRPARAIGDGLAPVLDLWRTAALLRRHDQRLAARRLLDASGAGADGLPLLGYLRAAATTPDPGPAFGAVPALERLDAGLRELVAGRSDGRRAELPPGELAELAARLGEEFPKARADAGCPVFSSVDVMIAAESQQALEKGEFRIVVGEAHAPALLSVFPTDHFRRADGGDDPVAALLNRVFGAAGVRVGQVLIGRNTKIFPYRLGDPLVELRPHLPGTAGALPAAELRVRRSGAGVALFDDEGPLLLHPQLRPAAGFDPLAPLALPAVEDHPVVLPGHTPRVTVGGVVYQRERWQVPGLPWDAALGGWALMRAAREWHRRCGMPEQVYYRTPEEPKPMLLDFASRHLTEVFHRHVARSTGPVTVSEMLPGPGELWLPGSEGRHTFELRAFAVHDGGPDGGWRVHRTG